MEYIDELFPFNVFDEEMTEYRTLEMSVSDFLAIIKLLNTYKPKTILEIGAWTGSCTCLFGLYAKKNGAKVYSIDNFNGSPGSVQHAYSKQARKQFLNNLKMFGVERQVKFLEGSSDSFASMDKEFDMVFIDADHRYSQFKKDMDNYFPKVKEGGIISGHDYNSVDYDERYIEEDFVNGVHHGVTKCLSEYNNLRLFVEDDPNKEGGKRLTSSIWYVEKELAPALV